MTSSGPNHLGGSVQDSVMFLGLGEIRLASIMNHPAGCLVSYICAILSSYSQWRLPPAERRWGGDEPAVLYLPPLSQCRAAARCNSGVTDIYEHMVSDTTARRNGTATVFAPTLVWISRLFSRPRAAGALLTEPV